MKLGMAPASPRATGMLEIPFPWDGRRPTACDRQRKAFFGRLLTL